NPAARLLHLVPGSGARADRLGSAGFNLSEVSLYQPGLCTDRCAGDHPMHWGHYTYAREPVFSWIRDHWHLSRNYYDRVGHFAQGFVPAIIAREVFIRRRIVRRGGWMFFIVLCVCLA